MSDDKGSREDGYNVTYLLSRIYEDDDVIVYTAPNEEELKNILLNLLREKGRMSVKDFHKYLSGLASEDKIRYALSDLLRRDLVTMDRQGFFYITELLEGSQEDMESGYYANIDPGNEENSVSADGLDGSSEHYDGQ